MSQTITGGIINSSRYNVKVLKSSMQSIVQRNGPRIDSLGRGQPTLPLASVSFIFVRIIELLAFANIMKVLWVNDFSRNSPCFVKDDQIMSNDHPISGTGNFG